MPSNSLGTLFRMTTWGESHGPAIGVVIDGCPAGLPITAALIDEALARRRPGQPYTSARSELDLIEILSGVFEGHTTGAPIALLLRNSDARPADYAQVSQLFRPGHANFTYLHKYGCMDSHGGGRASARETACRVAAGAVAAVLCRQSGIELLAYLEQVGSLRSQMPLESIRPEQIRPSTFFSPDPIMQKELPPLLTSLSEEGDSIGGCVVLTSSPLPIGLGDPIYEKLEANLAKAMLSLPASKGFEIGEGFAVIEKRGSEHNDAFTLKEGRVVSASNHAGGTLGGISTGEPLFCRIAFKPTSSIKKPQSTVTLSGKKTVVTTEGRHDPCVAIRAVPVVEAMAYLVLADALLMHRLSRL